MREENIKKCDSEVEAALSLTQGVAWDLLSDEDRLVRDRELFEFYNDQKAEMCYADDIFFSGKLLPLKASPLQNHYDQKSKKDGYETCPVSGQLINNKLSVEYQEVHRISSSNSPTMSTPVTEIPILKRKSTRDGNFSIRKSSSTSSSSSSSSLGKPKWHLFIFGLMKMPAKMDMRDMRNRFKRKNPSAFVAACDGRKTIPSKSRKASERRHWNLLGALSCRAYADVAVTASLSCILRK